MITVTQRKYALFSPNFGQFCNFWTTYSYACRAPQPLIILDILNNQCIESLTKNETKNYLGFWLYFVFLKDPLWDILFFDPFPCKTMKMKLASIGRSFERVKIVIKNQNIFFSTYVTSYSKHSLEKMQQMNGGEGAGLHIFMRDVSAERSEISRRIEYLQNNIFRGYPWKKVARV